MEGGFVEPEHLEDDEITYELGIRGMPPVVSEHRIQILRQRILMEMRGEAPPPVKSFNTDLCAEIELCSNKLLQMEKALVLVAGTDSRLEMAMLLSRFVHLSARLSRIDSDDNRVMNKARFLKQKLAEYFDLLQLAYDNKIVLKDNLKGMCSQTESKVAGALSDTGLSPSRSLGAVKKFRSDCKAYLPLPSDKNNDQVSTNTLVNIRSQEGGTPRDDGGEGLSFRLEQLGFSEEHLAVLDEVAKPISSTPQRQGLPKVGFENFDTPAPRRLIPSNTGNYDLLVGNQDYNNMYPRQSNLPRVTERPAFKKPVYQPIIQQPINQPHIRPQVQTPDIQELEYEPIRPNLQIPNIAQANYQPIRPRASHYRNPIPSWHLVFSGDGKGLNINQFMTQIHLMARADRVTSEELLASAIHLFDGPARNWYIAFEGLFETWEQLTTSLRESFVPHDGDFMVLKEVEQRHQGREEPFILYLSSLLNLFKHLREPLTERKKVDLVMRNMSPYLADRVALVDIQDTHHLAILCKKVEDVRNRSKSFRQTSNDEVTPIRKYAHELEVHVPNVLIPNTSMVLARKPTPNLVCWNCLDTDHLFPDCKHPKMRIFCYTCGELGQLANQCNSCQEPKNQVARLGNPNNYVRGGYRK